MIRSDKFILPAFTIFEATVVVAIMGIIIAIVSYSLNRLNEQVHLANGISEKINQFNIVRSSFWEDACSSDSLVNNEGSLIFYTNGSAISYSIEDDTLIRNNKDISQSFGLRCDNMDVTNEDLGESVTISLSFNEQPVEFSMNRSKNIDCIINDYFSTRYGK